MKPLYLGSMAAADPDAMAYLHERMPSAFGVELRRLELPGLDFAYDARRGKRMEPTVNPPRLTEAMTALIAELRSPTR